MPIETLSATINANTTPKLACTGVTAANVPELVRANFKMEDRNSATLTEFAGLLQLFFQASSLRGRFDTYFLLMRWLGHADAQMPLPLDDDPLSPLALNSRWRRSHVLRGLIVRSPEIRKLFADTLGSMLAETRCVSFFAEAGLPQNRGFFGEAIARSVGYLIPTQRNDADLEQQFRRLYRKSKNARRFTEIPPEMFSEVVSAFSMPDHSDIWQPGTVALREALLLLCARIQALAFSQEFRARGNDDSITESPFFQISRLTDKFLEQDRGSGVEQAHREWREAVKACYAEIREVEFNLNATGVSVSIVFDIEVIEKCLHRMEIIADVLKLPNGPVCSESIHRLISICIIATFEDRSLRSLVSSNIHLLSKKIVERSGTLGDHYIARNLKDYWGMWLAAAGGGLLTVATASFKMKIIGLHAAPLVEGVLASLNYALSFIIMLLLGLALATKQPAMTGAALAGILRENKVEDRLDRIADTMMLICRTQLAAAFANVIFVSAGCTLLANVWQQMYQQPILNAHEAEHVIESLNPLTSGTIVFAALTGVILWLSSLMGGWIENWSVCNKLPSAIADHPLGERIGIDRMRRIAKYWQTHIAAWGGVIALGLLLGFTPILGRFAGLPVDVRHVTLSTGTLALAAASLPEFHFSLIFMSALGIAITFVLNLSVSFLLAFITASRAYELSFQELLRLFSRVAFRALCRPWSFLLPIGWPVQADVAKH